MTIHIFGGGTFSHVRSHLALAAPAFGNTARQLWNKFHVTHTPNELKLHLTKMADHMSSVITNEDVEAEIDKLIADPECRVIIMNVALCDFDGSILEEGETTESGSHATRLRTRERSHRLMQLTPAAKLIGKIRKTRKDIFVVGFKTTCGATSDEQYLAALNMLKESSINLVVANDTLTRNNMIVAPEETRYNETTDRDSVLNTLVEMVMSRSKNTFTRSTVEEGDLRKFDSDPAIPENLREVVNHCVTRGAYKPFRGSTAGHFAVRVDEGRCLTSRRKTNYTAPGGLDLVEVEYKGLDKVIAYGAKPSVGGQSQRIVFDEHPDLDCIVHFHSPIKENARDLIPIADQAPYECGSHQCGANTSRNLKPFNGIHAVMLDNHGPNIVFSKEADPKDVIDFIEANFALERKTGGLVNALAA